MDFYFGVDLLHHLQKHYEQRLSLALSKSFNQTDSRYYWLFKELECRVTMLRKLLVISLIRDIVFFCTSKVVL